ncbi:DUF2087 domain-containing protein [Tabrizicola sp. J26]|uniref:DUF2087 domain-containing protein n=1 Tax=Alitabrizicola rongguiensis TaxID=2909234 RepID=UPI001F2554DE|nr:DUF2087 domain-containing protein [Tabrizicola rongguiensis]MCF1708085.1 DUF2087 domain-containing protein [Tabrizicola rongguiensis]
MTRTAFPFRVDDISALARSLRAQLPENAERPGHLTLMNMLARGAGYRNFQHFRAAQAADERLEAPPPPAPDHARVEQVMRHFDPAGRLLRWPSRTWMQHLALWPLWARFPRGEILSERQVTTLLRQWHDFDDPAILRRTLVELGLLWRTQDGREYRRIELAPSPEAKALIRLTHRSATG